jgi:hypothetical protein
VLVAPAPASQISSTQATVATQARQARETDPEANHAPAAVNPTPSASQQTVPDYTWCQWQYHGGLVLRTSTAHVRQLPCTTVSCPLTDGLPLETPNWT